MNDDELDAIAGFPSSTHKILVDDFSQLPALVDSVQQTICGGKCTQLSAGSLEGSVKQCKVGK